MRDIDGITYMNDGDWVESCTALVEHHDGRWELLHFIVASVATCFREAMLSSRSAASISSNLDPSFRASRIAGASLALVTSKKVKNLEKSTIL